MASFEDQLALRRPHLTASVLSTLSLSAWHEFGRNAEDPIKAAQALALLLDQQARRKDG